MKKIGLAGGGQLALMMLPSIKKLGFKSVVIDQSGASCDGKADEFRHGSFASEGDLQKLSDCDVVTFEIEAASTSGLQSLQESKIAVHPDPQVLSMIKNKGIQKSFLKEHDFPTSAFKIGPLKSFTDYDLKNKVIKMTTGGYDGKGVWITGKGEIPPEFYEIDCVVEDKVEIKLELAAVGVRSITGEVKLYDVVEMVMDSQLNLLDYQSSPAQIDLEQVEKINNMTQRILEELNYVGVLAIELFVDQNNQLWVNELSPRVHNSGHNTIESAPTSQFENHIRAITGLPLGETTPGKESMTVNLLGSGDVGKAQIKIDSALNENIKVHLYNKEQSRPGRKMGHATFVGRRELFPQIKEEIKQKVVINGINFEEKQSE